MNYKTKVLAMSVCKENENPCVGESAVHVSVIDNEISEKYIEIMIAETMQSLCIPIEGRKKRIITTDNYKPL